MKNILLLFVIFLSLSAGTPISTQETVITVPSQGTPRLYITGTEMATKAVVIKYDVTYAGFVELHLFDQEGSKVWIKGKVVDKVGSHVFPIPRKPLASGSRYSFILKYKGGEYSGSFYTE